MSMFRSPRRWRHLSLAAVVTLTGCVGGTACTEVGGIPLIALEVPDNAIVIEFCVDGFECTKSAEAFGRVAVEVDDEDRFDYSYTARVDIDGAMAEYAGDVTAEPLFPNGERCGRSGKTATITVVDADTVELSG